MRELMREGVPPRDADMHGSGSWGVGSRVGYGRSRYATGGINWEGERMLGQRNRLLTYFLWPSGSQVSLRDAQVSKAVSRAEQLLSVLAVCFHD